MSFHIASRQFTENIQLFSDPNTQPEKYNLYGGLKNLADGLEDLQGEIERLNYKLKQIKDKL